MSGQRRNRRAGDEWRARRAEEAVKIALEAINSSVERVLDETNETILKGNNESE